MVDELDTTTNDGDTLDLDETEEKEVDDIDPSVIIDEAEEVEGVEDLAVEEDAESLDKDDPFGFGEVGGRRDENGELIETGDDDEDEDDEIPEDLDLF